MKANMYVCALRDSKERTRTLWLTSFLAKDVNVLVYAVVPFRIPACHTKFKVKIQDPILEIPGGRAVVVCHDSR